MLVLWFMWWCRGVNVCKPSRQSTSQNIGLNKYHFIIVVDEFPHPPVLSQSESEIPHIIAPLEKHLLTDEYIHGCTTLMLFLSWELKTPCLIQYLLVQKLLAPTKNQQNKKKTELKKQVCIQSRSCLFFCCTIYISLLHIQ